MEDPSVRFTADDMEALTDYVSERWASALDADWTTLARGMDTSCLATADHAVDCTYAPAFFLASRRLDSYPGVGEDLMFGDEATPGKLIESLQIATRMLIGVVATAPAETEAVLFGSTDPEAGAITGTPPDFLSRAAVELILHGHDVCGGLGIEFEPDQQLCHRLREHTRAWRMWEFAWGAPMAESDDPWGDLLSASGRSRA